MRRKRIKALVESGVLPEEAANEFRGILKNRTTILPGWSASYLGKLEGVKTVIDVGVLSGTPALYTAFLDAYLVLVEALPHYEPVCREIVSDRPGEVHICAVGAEDGTAVIHHDIERPGQSTLLKRVGRQERRVESIQVPLFRMDTLFCGRDFAREVLLKIDTEGMEYQIVQGAPETLKHVKYCIAETRVKLLHYDSYRFADFVALMCNNGFELFDVLRVTRTRVLTPGAAIADLLFVRS